MRERTYVVVSLISLTLIPLELTWTRIFSAEFFYTFAFLVLSLAVLGLGLGALALRLWRSLNRESLLGLWLALSGLCALLGPIVVFELGLDFSVLFSSWAMVGRLLLTVLILMSAYFFGGMGLAMLFKQNHDHMPRLYMADLLGAGAGVLVAILAMNTLGTPLAAMLTAIPILVASIVVARRWLRLVPVAVAALTLPLIPSAESLLEIERPERAPVIYKHWDAMAKVKIYDYGEHGRGLNIDNVANSPVYSFDGNWDDVDPDEAEWGIDVSCLIQQFDSCVFLSLGAGGGSDVLQALVEGATEVHAVEVNPHLNYMMIHGDPGGYLPPGPAEPDTPTADPTVPVDTVSEADLAEAAADTLAMPVTANGVTEQADTTWRPVTVAEFSGHIYRDPRVTVVSEDARSYIRRFDRKFDVIYSLSSNTWAALASGAFALAENYLFTTEAYGDYWRALSDSGFMMMEHQMYVPRLVTEVMTALSDQGVEQPTEHFAVYNLPTMRRKIILLSKRPLTDSLRRHALGPLTPDRFDQIHLLYPASEDSVRGNQIEQIISEGWRNVQDTAAIDLSPVDDDRPFVAQLGLWRNVSGERLEKLPFYAEFTGFPLSKLVMVIILAVILLIVVPANLIPYATGGEHLEAAPWLYFFAIGAAFMAVEVVLIQKYALLIGASVHSLVAVLLTLLVASGVGSRFAREFSDRTAFSVIVVWLLADALIFKHLIYAAGGADLGVRLALAVALIFPLGFFMGMPFPKGALRVGQLIDWGFAVNGAASVLGSIGVLLVAFEWGFSVALILAAALYGVAWFLLQATSFRESKQTGALPDRVTVNKP
mgnify:CR=1 FL=1